MQRLSLGSSAAWPSALPGADTNAPWKGPTCGNQPLVTLLVPSIHVAVRTLDPVRSLWARDADRCRSPGVSMTPRCDEEDAQCGVCRAAREWNGNTYFAHASSRPHLSSLPHTRPDSCVTPTVQLYTWEAGRGNHQDHAAAPAGHRRAAAASRGRPPACALTRPLARPPPSTQRTRYMRHTVNDMPHSHLAPHPSSRIEPSCMHRSACLPIRHH